MPNKVLIEKAKEHFGTRNIKGAELRMFCESIGFDVAVNKEFEAYKVRRGVYNMGGHASAVSAPKTEKPAKTTAEKVEVPVEPAEVKLENLVKGMGIISNTETEKTFIPKVDDAFIPFGIADNLNKVVKSGKFLPVFVAGETGEGKTYITHQLSARAGREVIRVNCTPETDESDLIGDLRLIDGNTVFQKGPVLEAMERGAVLVLDEIDALSPSRGCFCLYSVLEGSGAFVKKTSTRVDHAPGFTVVATANTKGRGSESGKYIGTHLLNEAFLDRFDVLMEHSYPSPAITKKILVNNAGALDEDKKDFVDKLVTWVSIIRKTYEDGAIEETISTRRLVKIIKLYDVFGDRLEVIGMTIRRFSEEVVESMLDLYTKIDADPDKFKKDAGIEDEDEAKPDDASADPVATSTPAPTATAPTSTPTATPTSTPASTSTAKAGAPPF